MRNPDSLDVGEPGCKDNIELQHLNRSSLHFASLLSPAYWDRAWWRVEARRVGSDSPSVPAVVTAWWPRVCRQSISDSWLGNLRECLAHLV